jgi:hypothetical protein
MDMPRVTRICAYHIPYEPFLNVTCVTLTPSYVSVPGTCRLARVVGDVAETPGVRDFGTLEDSRCSITERPKGPKAGGMWQAHGTSEVRNFG